ncbi:MAG: hypothetical protein WC069_04445 [Candidatus Shapirobacteria bacterium]
MIKYFFIWMTVWILISILVVAFGYSNALGGVAVAALISLFFMIKMLAENWTGTVTDVKTEEVYSSDEDSVGTSTVEYAYIKLSNGKTKKIQNMGYKVGDKLEKLRGEASIRVIN